MPDISEPDFLGLGAQKAGTTWLYHALAHHPDISMPDCKEVHFWDRHYANGYAWYEGLFTDTESGAAAPPSSVARSAPGSSASKEASRERTRKISGEITPAYAIFPPATITEIAARYPALKLLYLVREPKARAWSAARMDFAKTGLRYDDTPDSWFLEHFHSEGSRARGDYLTCMRNWLSVFPKERLLLLDYAAIRNDPRGMLHAVASHLGVDKNYFSTLHEKHLILPRNESGKYALRPALAAELDQLYAGSYETFLSYVKKEKVRFFSS